MLRCVASTSLIAEFPYDPALRRPAQLGFPGPVCAPNWTPLLGPLPLVWGVAVVLSYLMLNCQPETLLRGWVLEALMMAPIVKKLVVGLLLDSMVASRVLVLLASRLRVQGGGVLAWTGGGLGGSVARARSMRSAGRALKRLNPHVIGRRG